MSIDLSALHRQISQAIEGLDFEAIWPGFRPLRFALYDEERCCFDGQYIPKTDDFCANTAILFQGERIAIWNVMEERPLPVFTSCIVHEMFHAFQEEQGWDCWADETEALFRYRYDGENLSLKLREDRLLLALARDFHGDLYREFLACRRARQSRFPYEVAYESRVEEIEGTATYVEWQVLEQLDRGEADKFFQKMEKLVTDPERLFPIRIPCYHTGALALRALRAAGDYSFAPARRPVPEALVETLDPAGLPPVEFGTETAVEEALDAFRGESRRIVETALRADQVVLTGPAQLISVNIYDARCYGGCVTTRFFLLCDQGGQEKLLNGNFVVKMGEGRTIETVYRWV